MLFMRRKPYPLGNMSTNFPSLGALGSVLKSIAIPESLDAAKIAKGGMIGLYVIEGAEPPF